MAFKYEATVQHGADTTEYVNLGKEGVSVTEFEGKKILKVSKEALTKIAQAAFEEVEFCLRPAQELFPLCKLHLLPRNPGLL